MGQAKQRGTFEQRQAAAIARNEALQHQIASLPTENAFKREIIRRPGLSMQRLAVGLMMLGALESVSKDK